MLGHSSSTFDPEPLRSLGSVLPIAQKSNLRLSDLPKVIQTANWQNPKAELLTLKLIPSPCPSSCRERQLSPLGEVAMMTQH